MNACLQLLGHLLGLRAPILALRPVGDKPSFTAVFRQLSQADGTFDATRLVPTAPDSLPPLQPPRLCRLNSGVADLFDSAGGIGGLTVDADKQPLVAAVHDVLARLWGRDALAVFTPDAFLKRMWLSLPRFAGYRQHDAEEFCRGLLVALDSELSPAPPRPSPQVSPAPTLLTSLVGGAVSSRVTCGTCGTVSAREEPFFGPLSVEVPQSARKGRGSCRLEDCLAAAFSDEALEGDSAYDCERCKRKCSAVLSRRLVRLPPVLIIHIVRTDWAAGGRKVMTTVVPPLLPSSGGMRGSRSIGKGADSAEHGSGPQLLDLRPWMLPPGSPPGAPPPEPARRRGAAVAAPAARAQAPAPSPLSSLHSGSTLYELRSVVEHAGATLSSGHYVNYSVHAAPSVAGDGGDWWMFNDTRVSRAPLTSVASAQAYLFGFEQRRSEY